MHPSNLHPLISTISRILQVPVIQVMLGQLGVVSSDQMFSAWRYVVVGSTVAAAVLTPSTDPFTQVHTYFVVGGMSESGKFTQVHACMSSSDLSMLTIIRPCWLYLSWGCTWEVLLRYEQLSSPGPRLLDTALKGGL